jgi:hypothetical protein
MQFAEEHYTRTKDRAEASLFLIPGVVGVALGPKIVGGKPTGTPAIQVYVRNKRGPAAVAPEHLIPASLEGVATDVLDGMFPVAMYSRSRARSVKKRRSGWTASSVVSVGSGRRRVRRGPPSHRHSQARCRSTS